MHKNLVFFNLYSVLQSSVVNAIFAGGICNTRVSAYMVFCAFLCLFYTRNVEIRSL